MVIKEPAGVKFAMGENPKRVGRENKRAPHTRMAVAHTIRKAFYDALDYRNDIIEYEHKIKNMSNDDNKEFIKPPKLINLVGKSIS